jgi:DNA-binding response OmpR family regulator
MICDDDLGILEMLTLLLEDYGFTVCTEANSMNALKCIEVQNPDLLLLDIWMPVLSGDQVLRNIKANPKQDQLPVIMYSASTEGLSIANSAGANDYIAKPFDIDELVLKIKALTLTA